MLKLPEKPFSILQKFLSENKPTVYRYLVRQLRVAIKKNKDKIDLFEFTTGAHVHVAVVRDVEYESVLFDAIKYCSESEDYETAAKARDLLVLLRTREIDTLLDTLDNSEE